MDFFFFFHTQVHMDSHKQMFILQTVISFCLQCLIDGFERAVTTLFVQSMYDSFAAIKSVVMQLWHQRGWLKTQLSRRHGTQPQPSGKFEYPTDTDEFDLVLW